MTHIINPAYYQDYLLSGNPEFTLVSGRTGNGEIFTVRKAKHDNFYWVNNRLRVWLGKIMPVPGVDSLWSFQIRREGLTVFEVKSQEIFNWFWVKMQTGQHIPVEIRYPGICGRCHRELTHPESLPIGIGPECFDKLGLVHKSLITSPLKTDI